MENPNQRAQQKMPYSYHTFMYPFSYEDREGGVLKEFPINEQLWREEADPGKGNVCHVGGQGVSEKELLIYNEYQYFFPQARRYIFNSRSESEHMLYSLKGVGYESGSSYSIKAKGRDYKLFLNNIRLSVYPRLSIGILIFETEYYPDAGKRSFADVLDINDLGRRLFPPCIAYQDEKLRSILTADEISVSISSERNYSIQFHQNEYENEQKIGFIRQILGIQENQANIKAILDDRMFTACIVRDDAISQTPFLKELHKGLDDWEKCEEGNRDVEKIYEFVYMDQKGDCTCQSRRMLEQELKSHIYDRWVNYGTFHGITEYSFVCATGEADFLRGSVINPFLTIYVDMAKLALAQRAALTKIEDAIPEITHGGIKNDKDVEEIREIWEQYLLCQSKLCLPEVTFQQQGVELYQMLKEALRINDIGAKLEEKLDNLHNIAELYYQKKEQENDKESSDYINYITIIGLPLAVSALALDYLLGIIGFKEEKSCIVIICSAVVCVVIPLIAALLSSRVVKKWRSKQRSKKDNNATNSGAPA